MTLCFPSIFKWEFRKAPEILVQAYLEEFTSQDNVLLLILTYDTTVLRVAVPHMEYEYSFKQAEKDRPKMWFSLDKFSDSEILSLYKSADCFVLPSRGEGWGRPYVEAMSMALPVIATNWSGQTEFMNEQNSYLLELEGYDYDQSDALKLHRLAKPSIAHLKKLMRKVRVLLLLFVHENNSLFVGLQQPRGGQEGWREGEKRHDRKVSPGNSRGHHY